MHRGSILRVRWFAQHYINNIPTDGSKIKILDVGSMDINGSYRQIFINDIFEYTGLDIEEGPNVDIVLPNPYDWASADPPDRLTTDTYDVVICGQTFEHVEFFWLTMVEMVRVLKPNGLLCLVVPCTYGTHRHPVDCYRFNADSMVALARYTNLTILHIDTNCAPANDPIEEEYLKWWYGEKHVDTMFIGIKTYSGLTQLPNLKTYQCVQMDLGVLSTGFTSYKSYRESKKFYKIKRWLRNLFK